MGYERPQNLLTRLRRSLWAAGGARAALAALVVLGAALGVMRLVAVAPPLPSRHPPVPSGLADSVGFADSAALTDSGKAAAPIDSAAEAGPRGER